MPTSIGKDFNDQVCANLEDTSCMPAWHAISFSHLEKWTHNPSSHSTIWIDSTFHLNFWDHVAKSNIKASSLWNNIKFSDQPISPGVMSFIILITSSWSAWTVPKRPFPRKHLPISLLAFFFARLLGWLGLQLAQQRTVLRSYPWSLCGFSWRGTHWWGWWWGQYQNWS